MDKSTIFLYEKAFKMKKDGFKNEQIVIIPRDKIDFDAKTYMTDIGYFPSAKYHYRKREKGSDEHILILCIAGKGFVNKEMIVNSESLVIIPKGVHHEYMASDDAPWHIFWVHFATNEDFPFKEITLLNLSKEQTKTYMDIFVNMLHALSNEINEKSLRFTSNAIKYMVGIINNHVSEINKNHSHIIIRKTKKYVLENLRLPLSIEGICETFQVSKSHLFYLYKEEFGVSPHAYFTNLKMDIASNYLLITTMNVKQIAAALGYEDPYYFSRLFKKKYSLSPNHYRKKNQQE